MCERFRSRAFPPEDVSASPTLPLQWVSPLTATSRGAGATLLRWGVANQHECAFFTVERSLDAITFSAVTRLPADGKLPTYREFTYTDLLRHPVPAYYRVRQTDFGGTFSFSNVVTVGPGSAPEYSLSPNPVHTTLELRNYPAVDLAYRVISVLGREVASGRLSGEQRSVHVSDLPAGTYFLHASGEGGLVVTKRFQKL